MDKRKRANLAIEIEDAMTVVNSHRILPGKPCGKAGYMWVQPGKISTQKEQELHDMEPDKGMPQPAGGVMGCRLIKIAAKISHMRRDRR